MTQLTDMPDAVDSAHQRKTPPFGLLVAGRIAIGVWMLMFAALGASLVRADPGGSR